MAHVHRDGDGDKTAGSAASVARWRAAVAAARRQEAARLEKVADTLHYADPQLAAAYRAKAAGLTDPTGTLTGVDAEREAARLLRLSRATSDPVLAVGYREKAAELADQGHRR